MNYNFGFPPESDTFENNLNAVQMNPAPSSNPYLPPQHKIKSEPTTPFWWRGGASNDTEIEIPGPGGYYPVLAIGSYNGSHGNNLNSYSSGNAYLNAPSSSASIESGFQNSDPSTFDFSFRPLHGDQYSGGFSNGPYGSAFNSHPYASAQGNGSSSSVPIARRSRNPYPSALNGYIVPDDDPPPFGEIFGNTSSGMSGISNASSIYQPKENDRRTAVAPTALEGMDWDSVDVAVNCTETTALPVEEDIQPTSKGKARKGRSTLTEKKRLIRESTKSDQANTAMVNTESADVVVEDRNPLMQTRGQKAQKAQEARKQAQVPVSQTGGDRKGKGKMNEDTPSTPEMKMTMGSRFPNGSGIFGFDLGYLIDLPADPKTVAGVQKIFRDTNSGISQGMVAEYVEILKTNPRARFDGGPEPLLLALAEINGALEEWFGDQE